MDRAKAFSASLALACCMVLSAALLPAWAKLTDETDKTDASPSNHAARQDVMRPDIGRLPLYFLENQGQWDSRVLYKTMAKDSELFVSRDGVVLTMPAGPGLADMIRLRPLGACAQAAVRPGRPQETSMNFFLGSDRSKWRTRVRSYDAVVYEGLYPGINLRYHGDNRMLEYDYLVAPGAEPSHIRMEVSGVRAARIEADGAMLLTLQSGRELRQAAPLIYQERDGVRSVVPGGFRLQPNTPGQEYVFTFDVAQYDRTLPLVIDPTLSYSTYLGGLLNDSAYAVASVVGSDLQNHAVVVGSALSTPFPGANNIPGTVRALADVFVARFNSTGTALEFSTIIGGSMAEEARGVAVNNDNASPYYQYVYVTGYTKSANFPTSSALWAGLNGTAEDAFFLALNPTGDQLVVSSYFGGSGADFGNAIALDGSGSVYVAGTTGSTNMPVKNALFTANKGGTDGFVFKANPAGTVLYYSTYIGGEKDDAVNGLAVSPTGDAYLGGSTLSAVFPVKNAIQSTIAAAATKDGFLSHLNATGSALVFSTYLGGTNVDAVNAVALDPATHDIILTGVTNSTNFPTVNPLSASLAGGTDAFVAKVDSSGRFLRFSTYLGGSGDDAGLAVAVDQRPDAGSSYIYFGGSTFSADFPTTNPWTSTTYAGVGQSGNGYRGAGDGFVAKIEPNGLQLVYSSCLGGTALDTVYGLATPADANRTVFATGLTASPSSLVGSAFPTIGSPKPFQVCLGGGAADKTGQNDAFVTQIKDSSYDSNAPYLSLGVISAPLLVDTPFTMNLTYTDAVPASTISALSTTLQYDPQVMTLTGITKNPGAAYANCTLKTKDLGNGSYYVMIYDNLGGTLPAGAFASASFKVVYAGTSSILSKIANAPTATTTASIDIPIVGQAGLVNIALRSSELGDCDCSGLVDLWEVQLALRMSLGLVTPTACVMSNYLTMTAADLQLIINTHMTEVTAASSVSRAAGQTDSASATASRLGFGSITSTNGHTTAPVRLASGGNAISLIMTDIDYDPTLFSGAQVSPGPAATAAGKQVLSNILSPGKLRVVVASTTNNTAMADGEVAKIVFTSQNGEANPRGSFGLTATAADPAANPVTISGSGATFPAVNALPALHVLLK